MIPGLSPVQDVASTLNEIREALKQNNARMGQLVAIPSGGLLHRFVPRGFKKGIIVEEGNGPAT
jgi:hypothetical protein